MIKDRIDLYNMILDRLICGKLGDILVECTKCSKVVPLSTDAFIWIAHQWPRFGMINTEAIAGQMDADSYSNRRETITYNKGVLNMVPCTDCNEGCLVFKSMEYVLSPEVYMNRGRNKVGK